MDSKKKALRMEGKDSGSEDSEDLPVSRGPKN